MALLDMIQNLALIISLAMIYRVIMFRLKRSTRTIQVWIGLMFGSFTLVAMETPFHMMPGVFYDGRSIILCLAGLFCGPLTTLVAAVIAAAYRISLGGNGVFAGVGTVIEASLLGLAFYYLRRANKVQVNILTLTSLGALVSIGMLLMQLLLPEGLGLRVWREIGLYVLLFFTFATLLIGLLFLDSETQLKTRALLLKNEKTLKKAQQIAHVGNWVWRARDNHLEASDEFQNILGLPENAIPCNLTDVLRRQVHTEDAYVLKDAWALILAGEPPKRIEFRLVRVDGSIRNVWVETGEVLLDGKGQVESASGVLQDITEQRQAEKELIENESRYRSLIMNSPDAILVNHEDRIIMANHAAVVLFAAEDVSALIGKTPWDLFHPDFHAVMKERIHHLRDLGEIVPVIQEQIVRCDGQVVDVDVVSAPFTFQGGNDIHVILRDITHRKQMEDELRASHDLLTRLADQVPGAVFQFYMHPDGRKFFPFTSPSVAKTYGLSPEELRRSAYPALMRIHPEDRGPMARALLETMRSLEVLNFEFRVFVSEQEARWYQCTAQPERLTDGGTLWSGILSDITDRKLDEQKIGDQLNELRRWQSVMLGREKRAIELKQEVNALLKEMGQSARYHIEDNGSFSYHPSQSISASSTGDDFSGDQPK